MENKNEILINEPEVVETKTSNKVKFTMAIIATTLVLAAATTLLIGHFKFDWFKSDNYKIDANINRSVYQANYFSEKKTVATQFVFTDGHIEKKEYILDTNFVVFLTDKKENMNTASLILLSSVANVDEEVKELPHLNLFDEKVIKEIEADPDGSKYPMAVFKFDDDGKIEEIKLPNNMDEYDAQTVLELIEKVIPRLSRSRQEDMSNGLEIKTKKSKNKRIIVQNEAPKQIETFKGSKVSRIVKTEIEDDQITSIESDSDIHMQSEPEEEDEIIFGPQDFKMNMKSNIVSKEVKYEQKENVELINKLAARFTLIDSKDLLQSIKDKKEEKKKEVEEILTEEVQQPLRNLANFPITASKTYNLATLNVLGQTVTIKYVVSFTNSRATNKIVISSNLGYFEFGNTGVNALISKSYSYDKYVFKFVVPNFPIVSVGCYVKGSLFFMISFNAGSGTGSTFLATLSGTLALGAEVKAGWDWIASLSAFAEGTVADAQGTLLITNGSVSKMSSFSLRMGNLVAGIRGCLFKIFKKTLFKVTIFKGWRII